MKPIIEVENLSKLYQIGAKEAYGSLRDEIMQAITSPFKCLKPNTSNLSPITDSNTDTNLWALKDVSFEVNEGEVVGIIGRNGAGKSTLLKILSRITEPTSGKITMRGRVASLLEVGTGFHPELTGRENIFLNGALLGMTNAEIKSKFDEIVAFSEIEKFLDTPVKRYSSGMYVRLAFAVAAHLEPEILVIDEVLAVGDAQFQKKCLGKMGEVAKSGRTVLFVSHNMGAVSELCNKSILLKAGNLACMGDTNEIIQRYLSLDTQKTSIVFRDDDHHPTHVADVLVLDKDGQGRNIFDINEDIIVQVQYNVKKGISDLITVVTLYRNGTPVFHTYSSDYDIALMEHSTGYYIADCVIPKMFLKAGRYSIDISTTTPLIDFQKFMDVKQFEIQERSINAANKGFKEQRLGDVIFPGVWRVGRKEELKGAQRHS